jgi:hypothetical protein
MLLLFIFLILRHIALLLASLMLARNCSLAWAWLQTGRHDIAEILLKVALKHHKSKKNQYNRSRHFHISVVTTFSYQCGNKFIIRAHFSTYIYAYKVRNNASFITVNPITVDSIIFVGINFRKLKKKWQVVDTHFRGLWNFTRSSFIK